ncbi:hypothetical protein BD779DRAFT_1670946 [Infundibulicybe gibba]|nr:hypothetical protein BD779DRAFT_1670946 [Infundibulicybe gibba]
MSFKDLIQTLQASPSLKHLWLIELILDHSWPNSLHHYRPVALSHLQSLEISDRQSRTCLPLLAISAPALHSLTLHNFVSDDFPHALSNVICRNAPNVRSLTIVGPELRASDTTNLPYIFPLITDLAVLRIKPGHHALSQLLQKDTLATGSLVWPDLTTITLASVPESINFLLYLVKSRIRQGHSLKTLVLPRPERIKKINQLREQVEVRPCSELQSAPYVKEVPGQIPQSSVGRVQNHDDCHVFHWKIFLITIPKSRFNAAVQML